MVETGTVQANLSGLPVRVLWSIYKHQGYVKAELKASERGFVSRSGGTYWATHPCLNRTDGCFAARNMAMCEDFDVAL